MSDLTALTVDLEQQRRSLAMLPPGTPITRETALELIERCQTVVATAAKTLQSDPNRP